jgi:hypothetical protein
MNRRRPQMMDIVYLGIALVFFAASWGLLALIERL